MNDEIPENANGRAPRQIADLRTMPLTELAADHDGVVAVLRDRVLDGEERLRVAAFNSSI